MKNDVRSVSKTHTQIYQIFIFLFLASADGNEEKRSNKKFVHSFILFFVIRYGSVLVDVNYYLVLLKNLAKRKIVKIVYVHFLLNGMN
jgi:hypothetical protein